MVSQRTLVMLSRGEPPSVSARAIQPYSGSLKGPIRLFNAMLDFIDDREIPQPYLAEALPQVYSDSWRIFPDGRMETTYRLRPNLTWHDGAPATAADFVFGWQVFSAPALGGAGIEPINEIEEVAAPDERTVVIRWRRLYADAGAFDLNFQALPRHILEEHYRQLDPQLFTNLPFWGPEYVGLGPYRLEQWIPGASLEASAFDGHALGKAKIERVRVLFVTDNNAAMAAMLSGEAQFANELVFFYEEAAALEQEWIARGGPSVGKVVYAPTLHRPTLVQVRPEYASPPALLDARVRKAIAHGMDAPSAVEVTSGGKGLLTWSLTSPRADFYPVIERAIEKRSYDPRATQRYLEEVGMVRTADGSYVMTNGEPFRLEVATDGGTTNERENLIFVDSLRRAGVDAYSKVIPVAQMRDLQARTVLPGLNTGGIGSKSLAQMTTANIPRAENRWAGNNRGGWSNAEYDRLAQTVRTTVDRGERVQQIARMEQVLSEEVPVIPNLFTPVAIAHVPALKGPTIRSTPEAGWGTLLIHTWEWTS
jgi:peptide/nickel transport system substrate-binding protein